MAFVYESSRFGKPRETNGQFYIEPQEYNIKPNKVHFNSTAKKSIDNKKNKISEKQKFL